MAPLPMPPSATPPVRSLSDQIKDITNASTAQLELVKDLQNQCKALNERLSALEKKVG